LPKPLAEWIQLLIPQINRTSNNVLIRVDAGKIWGLSFGHLSRCISIANTVKNLYGLHTHFLMKDFPEGIAFARNSGQNVWILPLGVNKIQEKEEILNVIDKFGIGYFINDLPYSDLDTSYFCELRNKGIKIVFLDDNRFVSPDVDVILNSSILATVNTQKTRNNIRYLLGPDYFIFDSLPQFRKPEKRTNNLKVLVTFGGSDPAGLTMKVLRVLSKESFPGVHFEVVLGPGYSDTEQTKKYADTFLKNTIIVCNPSDIYPFFMNCDLVICGGGRTLYELYTLKVPTLAIASIDHEAPVINAFLEQKKLMAGLELWDKKEFLSQLGISIGRVAKQRKDVFSNNCN
jgi:spore coat polysaccharide biosynthesis predicted glycosyltransferase SpsG